MQAVAGVQHDIAAAVFFVREEGHHEVTRWLTPAAQDVCDRGEDHGVHVLHVDRAASPQHPVANLSCEGVDRPVLSDSWHDVEVPVKEQVRVMAAAGYRGLYCFEWEKKWHPTIEEPEVAFPDYAKKMAEYLSAAGVKQS